MFLLHAATGQSSCVALILGLCYAAALTCSCVSIAGALLEEQLWEIEGRDAQLQPAAVQRAEASSSEAACTEETRGTCGPVLITLGDRDPTTPRSIVDK